MELLQLPETEMFELLAVQRRKLIHWLRQCGQISLNVIMEAIMRVTTGTGNYFFLFFFFVGGRDVLNQLFTKIN